MRLRLLVMIATGALALAACGETADAPAPSEAEASAPRVLALGGSVAETVYALGADSLLVARDASSVYPEAVLALPSVGYFRQLGAEGVLSANPTLILADPNAGPASVLGQIEAAGVEVVRLPGGSSADDAAAQVVAVGEALGLERAAAALTDSLRADLARADALVERSTAQPSVLFVLGQGGGTLSVAGTGTNADTFIRLAGGENAFGAVEGYKPMTAEALVDAAPDVLFMMGRTAAAIGGVEAFAARPEVAGTPAAQHGRIVVLPDAALSFGPSLGRFVLDFARTLHPEVARSESVAAEVES
jgi:iron complex transport system substrate-binding protein